MAIHIAKLLWQVSIWGEDFQILEELVLIRLINWFMKLFQRAWAWPIILIFNRPCGLSHQLQGVLLPLERISLTILSIEGSGTDLMLRYILHTGLMLSKLWGHPPGPKFYSTFIELYFLLGLKNYLLFRSLWV